MRGDKVKTENDANTVPSNFIQNIIAEEVAEGVNGGMVVTRFPPEPNGYLHIGHAKAININFGLAELFGGRCHLRFDDTNPVKEEDRFVEEIGNDIKWLGWNWHDNLYFASDYFGRMYDFAVKLIKAGKAYVCELNPDEVREYRGTLTKPGKESPFRDRSVDENLDLFKRMRDGEFETGSKMLRAKIDMSSGNINMRDPVMYRIIKTSHHRAGDKWNIYPMYDWAHGLEDSIEGVTHSLCSLEFEDHRPLYDWFLDAAEADCHPRQIEFARLNLTYTVMSKRKLGDLVAKAYVAGWDDPRMPTIAGLRRRGYTPESIRVFLERIGVAKSNSLVDIALLEHCLREDLNSKASRVMAVLEPVKVVIDNYPEGETEWLEAENNPEDPSMGSRKIPFSRTLFIERDDFMLDPPKKYFRLSPGSEVRFKHAYYIKCVDFVKDGNGEISEIHCTYDPETRGGWMEGGRKVKGTIHWVSAEHAADAEVRLYDHLFTKEIPDDFESCLNPDSLKIISGAKVEPSLVSSGPGTRFQFLRKGYFCTDNDSTDSKPVFNRTVSLRDSWAKINKSREKK